MTTTTRRRLFPLMVLLIAAIMQVVAASPAAAFTTPQYVRTIGGQGRPGVFAWGAQYNPVTDEVLIGDYLHFQIRRYDKQGNHLGDFWRENHFGQPYSIGVDPNDGAIYVAELKDNPLTTGIAKYDKDGNFLYALQASLSSSAQLQAFYPVWLTVTSDGTVWVADSHFAHTFDRPPTMIELTFDDAAQSVTIGRRWPILPPDVVDDTNIPRVYGIDYSETRGTIYLSDGWNRRGYEYDQDGNLLNMFGQTVTGGDNRGVAVNDTLGRVYLVDAQFSDVDVFNLDGVHQFSFGSEGTGPGQFAGGGRQITVDDEHNVWAPDFGGFRTLKFDADGNFLLQSPVPPRQPPNGLLGQPRDVAIDDVTGEIWVADAWNQRIQRFAPNGTFIAAYGHRGPGGAFQMNYPRSIAIDPVTRNIWVANERGHHLQVYGRGAGTNLVYLGQIGQIGQDDTDPGHFRWPTDIEFYGRRVVIGDRIGNVVKILNADTWQEIAQWDERNHGTAVDPATGLIYVLNGSSDVIVVYDQNGVEQFRFGSRGNGPGQFRDPVDAVFANNVLYIVDERLSNVQAFQPDGTYLGRWGQTYGLGAYEFRNPVGIDADAQGRLYVTDSMNDRIQVYDPALGRLFEPTAPTVTLGSPTPQSVLPLGPVTLQGTASDNVAVASVELSIQDVGSGLWWNANNSSWVADRTTILAAWTGNAPSTSVNWRWVFHGVSAGGTYIAEIKSRDHNGNLSGFTTTTFGMPGTTPPPAPPPPNVDLTPPEATLDSPTANQELPLATVNLTGTATDDVGIGLVQIAIKDVATQTWWTGTGWSTTFSWHETTLASPGAATTTWSYDWTPPAAGSYQVLVDGRDTSNNSDPTKPFVPFTVTDQTPDEVAPDTTLTAPTDGASFEGGPVDMSGTATDDRGVAGVDLGIQDTLTGQWWTGSAWSSTPVTVAATLDTPGGTSTGWTFAWSPPAPGDYLVQATARDAAGNVDATPPSAAFTVTGAVPDTVPPDGTVSSPTANSSIPAGPMSFTGNATDDREVASVQVAIRNAADGTWWNGAGWGAGFVWNNATLSSPGATSTGWSYAWNPAAGSYGVTVRAVDGAGNVDPTRPWVPFSVTGGAVDTTPPDATVSNPAMNAVLPLGPLSLTGNATDDTALGVVEVAIRDRTSGLWWRTNGTWGAFQWHAATLDTPGGTASGWSMAWTPPAAGNYAILVRATDLAGNVDPTRPWVPFSVS